MKILRELTPHNLTSSYFQREENLIVDFDLLQVLRQLFLDLGTHYSRYLNSIYFFCERVYAGAYIEPDPLLWVEIKLRRKKDIYLDVGVRTTQQPEVYFFMMTTETLNTFSEKEAERYQAYRKQKIEKVTKLPLITINQIISQNFSGFLNLILMSIKELELDILQTFDFVMSKLELFYIETLTHMEDNAERKLSEVIDYISQNGYFVCVDTFINTIFVSKTAWSQRP